MLTVFLCVIILFCFFSLSKKACWGHTSAALYSAYLLLSMLPWELLTTTLFLFSFAAGTGDISASLLRRTELFHLVTLPFFCSGFPAHQERTSNKHLSSLTISCLPPLFVILNLTPYYNVDKSAMANKFTGQLNELLKHPHWMVFLNEFQRADSRCGNKPSFGGSLN